MRVYRNYDIHKNFRQNFLAAVHGLFLSVNNWTYVLLAPTELRPRYITRTFRSKQSRVVGLGQATGYKARSRGLGQVRGDKAKLRGTRPNTGDLG